MKILTASLCGLPVLAFALYSPGAAAQPGGCEPGDPSALPAGLQAADVPSGSIRRADTAMGTTLSLGASGVPCEEATAAFAEVFEEFHRVEVLTSTEHPDSELRKINEAAGGDPLVVDEELFRLIQWALAFAEETGGAFDPTFAAMDGLWKFEGQPPPPPSAAGAEVPPPAVAAAPAEGAALAEGAEAHAASPSPAMAPPPAERVPPPEEIEARLALVDWTQVEIDPVKRTVLLKSPGMKLSLGGIAKGYATDRAVAILKRRQVPHFIIRSGGEMYIEGDPGGGTRRIGVPDPRGPGAFALVEVRGRALNISQDTRRSFVEGGVRYHHIIDPRTGYPAHHVRTVAVMAADATAADALSTAVFVLGAKRGLELLEKNVDVEGIIVDGASGVHVSSGFGPRLQLQPPTPTSP